MTDAPAGDAPTRATPNRDHPDIVTFAVWLTWRREGLSIGDIAEKAGGLSRKVVKEGVQAATHAEWAALWRRGKSLDDVAALAEETPARIRRGVQAALRLAGKLAETDDATPFAPFDLLSTWGSSCKAKPTCEDIHPGGRLPAGSTLCCEACGQSGMDGHPSLLLRPADVE